MSGNALLDVAIGLALLYLLLSLFVTIINEWIGGIFKLRARNLGRALGRLIDDPGLKELFDKSPAVRALKEVAGRVGPSYMPAEQFVIALTSAVNGSRSLDRKTALAELRGAVENLPNSTIKGQLQSLLGLAGDSLENLEAGIGRWFDQMMDRASGVFRRQMQAISFAVAIILVGTLNVDTMHVAGALWFDETLRQQLTQSASDFVLDGSEPGEILDLAAVEAELRPFPMGWAERVESLESAADWLWMAIGWFLSAAAISLGAPFWFGVLEKLTRIRGSGNPPAPGAAGGTRMARRRPEPKEG